MMDIDKIREDIEKLEDGPMTWANCERLANLYTILHHHEKRADIESIGEAMINKYGSNTSKDPLTEAVHTNSYRAIRVVNEHMARMKATMPKEYEAMIKELEAIKHE